MSTASATSGWHRFAPYLLLAAVVFAVYSNIYENAFLFDDDLLIKLNTYLRSWDTFGKIFTASTTEGAHIAGGFYRPVQNILYFFIFQLNGERPFLFHLLNVSLHAANACLGYRLAMQLGLNPRASLLAMLIWAVHPLHVEAITYMSGTADPLFVFFSLCGLNVIFPTPTPRHIWFSVPLFALALLSKETAVVFPALVCVCLYYVSEQRLQPKTYLATWPLWLVAMIFLAWRVTSTDFDGPARYAQLFHMPQYANMQYYAEDPFVRAMTFLATLPSYTQLLLWPVGLHMERAFPLFDDPLALPVVIGFVMLAAALTEIIRNRRPNAHALNWGLLWFGAAHAPNSGVLFSMNSLFLEHWMYLPTLGLFLGIAQSATGLLGRLKNRFDGYAAGGLALVVIAALSARTYDQNEVWHDPIGFYNNLFSYGITSARARNNLAIAYMDAHNLPKAIEEYRKAIGEGDTYAETHYNLALALLQMPDQNNYEPQALAELQRSLEIEPRFVRTYIALSEFYRMRGDKEKAATYDRKARELIGN